MKVKLVPGSLLAAVGALAGYLGWRASLLRVEVNDLELLPATSEVLAVDAEIRRTFGSDERLILCFERRDGGGLDAGFLRDFRFFVRELSRDHNIGMLLVDRFDQARFEVRRGEAAQYLLHPPSLDWLDRAYVSSTLVRTLGVSRSRRAVFLETPALSSAGVRSIEERARSSLAALERKEPGHYAVRVVGRQVILNGLGEAISKDLQRLLPWTLLVLFIALSVIFRSMILALLPLLEVGLSVVCTLGILQVLGFQLSLMTFLVPVLLLALGVADEIHLVAEFLRLRFLDPGMEASRLAREAVRRVMFPILATSLTTAIGFFSFFATEAPALRTFGLTAGIGVMFSCLFTLLLIPVLLPLVPASAGPAWTRHSGSLQRSRLTGGGLAGLLSLALIPGIWRLEVDDGWTRNFRPQHRIVQDARWFQRESVGLYQFDVLLERTDSRRWNDPALLRRLERLQEKLAREPLVTAAVSLVDLVRDRAWELGDPAASRPPLPASIPEIDRILHTYRIFNQQIFRLSLLDHERRKTRLIVFTAGDDYEISSRVRAAIRRRVAETFGAGVRIAIGGSAERGRILIGTVVSTQVRSIAAALLMSWLVLGFISGRWWLALRCVLAIAWALLLVLGLAGWAGWSLGVASSCFLALGTGIGLDYVIHFAFGRAYPASDRISASTAELRVLANVLVVGSGLAVLLLSSNPTVCKLGGLIVLSMAASCYTGLVFFTRTRRGAPSENHGSAPPPPPAATRTARP